MCLDGSGCVLYVLRLCVVLVVSMDSIYLQFDCLVGVCRFCVLVVLCLKFGCGCLPGDWGLMC